MGSTFRIRTSMARRDFRYLRLRLKKTKKREKKEKKKKRKRKKVDHELVRAKDGGDGLRECVSSKYSWNWETTFYMAPWCDAAAKQAKMHEWIEPRTWRLRRTATAKETRRGAGRGRCNR